MVAGLGVPIFRVYTVTDLDICVSLTRFIPKNTVTRVQVNENC